MEKNEIPTYEDGLEKDEKIGLSHLRAGTYAHRKLDPNTGKMVEVKEQCERQVEQLRVNCGEPGP
jgi:hypothetical protein